MQAWKCMDTEPKVNTTQSTKARPSVSSVSATLLLYHELQVLTHRR